MNTIPEIPLKMMPKSKEAKDVIGFEWNSDAGRNHKLGGKPDWIQDDETPKCRGCKKSMTFYGQLDCIGDDVSLGDCGMIYVFVCMECLNTQSVLQTG